MGSERSVPWNVYGSLNESPAQTGIASGGAQTKGSDTSMSAISFGFVATAILISMFLIMAIFEHLFRPTPPFSVPQIIVDEESIESGSVGKQRHSQNVSTLFESGFSVLMPGEENPTCIAKLAPLPCTRERIYWPSHEHNLPVPYN